MSTDTQEEPNEPTPQEELEYYRTERSRLTVERDTARAEAEALRAELAQSKGIIAELHRAYRAEINELQAELAKLRAQGGEGKA